MNIDILERYDKTDDGKYIVSIKADSYKALFNEYDFSSSFWKRDLREDFVAYLIDCVDEIGLKTILSLRFFFLALKTGTTILKKNSTMLCIIIFTI